MSVLRLPPELFVIMLELCHKEEPFRFPWLASEVCSQWRQVILNTPTLWTDIRLGFYSTGRMRSQALVERTRTPEALDAYHANEVNRAQHQLVRSRGLPLHVSFFTRLDSGPFDLLHEAINLVFIQNAHRIRELFISDACVGLIALGAAIQQAPVPMPLLKTMDVSAHTTDRPSAERDLLPRHAFRLATNLVSVVFHDFLPTPSDLRWSHLTDLTISCIEIRDVLPVLPHLGNLIDLKLNGCCMTTPITPSEMTSVVLPSLLHLFIDCIPSALRIITTPILKTLSLMMWKDEELALVIAFLQRSQCADSIHTLELSYLTIGLQATISLLSCMPYVKKLDWKGGISEEPPIPTVVHVLALRGYNGRFKCCPRLNQLVLDLPDTHPWHFINMIEQRWRTRPQDDECDTLREVELMFNEDLWTEDRGGCEDIFGRRIRRLMKEGMLVDVKYIGQEGEAWDFFQEIFA